MTDSKGVWLLRLSFRQCVEPESSDVCFRMLHAEKMRVLISKPKEGRPVTRSIGWLRILFSWREAERILLLL